MAKRVSPDRSNLCSSLPKSDYAAPLSGEKPAGDLPPTGQTVPRMPWVPQAPLRKGLNSLARGSLVSGVAGGDGIITQAWKLQHDIQHSL